MSKNRPTRKSASGDERRIVVRAQPRAEPDLRRLARALIELARKDLEREETEAAAAPAPPDDGEAA